MKLVRILCVIGSLSLLASCAKAPQEPVPISDHFDGKHFYNPIKDPEIGPMPFLYWKTIDHPKPWPKNVSTPYADKPPSQVNDSVRLSFVGHSTFLIQTQGVNILTDPIWSDWIGPDQTFSTQRVTPPGIAFKNLPKIDIVVISHNHYDHMDIPTILQLEKTYQPLFIMPLENKIFLQKYAPHIKVKELDWHESYQYNEQLDIYLEPAQHWSERNFVDTNKSLWGSYVFVTPQAKILFMGDSAYGEGKNYEYLAKRHGPFHVALLPIGAYEPRWYTKQHHMNPEEAILAHQDLGGPTTVAMHFATFHLTDEPYHAPEKALEKAALKHKVPKEKFKTLKVGEAIELPY